MPISSLHSDHDNPITVLKGHLQLIEMGTPWHWRIDDCTHPQPGITHHTASYERSFGKCFATMGKVYKRASWILCVQSRKWCLSTNGYLIILRAFAMALTSAIFPVPDDLPLRSELAFLEFMCPWHSVRSSSIICGSLLRYFDTPKAPKSGWFKKY